MRFTVEQKTSQSTRLEGTKQDYIQNQYPFPSSPDEQKPERIKIKLNTPLMKTCSNRRRYGKKSRGLVELRKIPINLASEEPVNRPSEIDETLKEGWRGS
jgi:hypothetical protein